VTSVNTGATRTLSAALGRRETCGGSTEAIRELAEAPLGELVQIRVLAVEHI